MDANHACLHGESPIVNDNDRASWHLILGRTTDSGKKTFWPPDRGETEGVSTLS